MALLEVLGFEIPNWIIYLIAAIFLLYLYGIWPYSYWRKRGIKGPPMLPFIGDLNVSKKLGFRKQMAENFKKYGPIYCTFMLRQPMLMIADTELLKQILIKEFDKFSDRKRTPQMKPLDRGVTLLSGHEWKRIRGLLTPSFTSGKLKAMFPLVDEAAKKMCDKLSSVQEDEEVTIKDFCTNFTLDVIASSMFGLKINSQENPDNEFKKHGNRIFNLNFKNIKLILMLLFPSLALKIYAKFKISIFPKDSLDFFVDVIRQALKERREGADAGRYHDFLASMISAREEGEESNKGLTEDEVLAQSLTFFLAGFETTSSALHFCIYFLALNPDCAERCFQEVSKAGELNYETVMSLKYLNQCLEESQRLSPGAVLTQRICTKPTVINGLEFEEGVAVGVPIHFLANDPDVWADPEKFDPDRFGPDESAARDALSFIPFGAGPRNCIGMRLAQMQMRKGLAELLLRFKFEPVASTPTFDKLEFKALGSSNAPVDPIKLRVVKRND